VSHASHSDERGERLVAMANDIGNYFRPQGREEAVAGIANHIKRYWTLRMREKLNAYLAQGKEGLDELPRAAVEQLNEQSPASKPKDGPGPSIARPGPWAEGRYRRRGQPLDESVLPPAGAYPYPEDTTSTPVTRKDYEFPGEEAQKKESSDGDPPGGDAG
jgi:formate dehydrogenase subunit delta